MMGIALGGIGVVSLRIPLAWSKSIFHVLDLPSILLATFLVAIFGLIAYFTNPSEASFRSFLTELAFRQHLSRLSEAQNIDPDDYDEEPATSNNTARLPDDAHTRKPGKSSNRQSNSSDNVPIVFHFANKASVSLRTPNYDFRSFAVLTFAIVSPVEMTVASTPSPAPAHAHPPKPISWSNPAIHGAWFVGAFGRWWLGLEMNMQPRHVRLAAHDDAALHERELNRIRPDDVDSNTTGQEEISANKAAKPSVSRRASTAAPVRTKAALRERLSLQTQLASHKRDTPNIPARPTTPPPLPKSASLPLHTKRVIPTPSPELRKIKSSSSTHTPPLLPTSALPPSQSSPVQDRSPVIAGLVQQLDVARSATLELQTQLNSVHTASTATVATLEAEVAAARAMKKSEDIGRAAVKAQTKVLDDRRRQADAIKRDAEKKHKAMVAQRDGTTSRIERLEKEVEAMQRGMEETVVRVEGERIRVGQEHIMVTEELTVRREELKVAEEEVQILSARARELESAIADGSTRIAKLKAQKEKQKRSLWPPPLSVRTSPHNRFGPLPSPGPLLINPGLSAGLEVPSQFRPFADSPMSPGTLSPVSASLIPSSLMHSMDIPAQNTIALANSYFPTSDTVYSPVDGSPNFTRHEEPLRYDEPLRLSESQRRIRFDESLDTQTSRLIQRPRSPSPMVSKHRRWFTSGKEKGLNPDAKEFTLPSRSARSSDQIPAADIFRPHSAATENFPTAADIFHPTVSSTVSDYCTSPESSPPPRLGLAGSFFSSLQNAFAPSPAEREALQRALGSGSMNSSREVVAGGSITSGLERVSSHGSGSGGSGGSHNTSPHWGATIVPNNTHRTRSIFNPWAGEGKE